MKSRYARFVLWLIAPAIKLYFSRPKVEIRRNDVPPRPAPRELTPFPPIEFKQDPAADK